MKLKVVTWNMGCASRNSGFLAAHDAAWRYLLNEHRPDVALVQEAIVPDWLDQEEWTAILGAVPTESHGHAAIVARTNLTLASVAHDYLLADVLAPYLVMADLTLGGIGRVIVGSVHARPYVVREALAADLAAQIRRKAIKAVWYSDVVFHVISEMLEPEQLFIIGGDWNEARMWDTVRGRPEGGVEFFERALSQGWRDALRKAHEEERETCFRGPHRYETDHIFTDETLFKKLAPPIIDDSTNVRRLSDHAILSVTFDL